MTDIALALVRQSGKWLVSRRAAGRVFAGHWEFPGGKIATGESPEAAAVREAREETGLEVEPVASLGNLPTRHDGREFRLHLVVCRAVAGDASAASPAITEIRWVDSAILGQLPMPPANTEIIERIQNLESLEPEAAGPLTPPRAGEAILPLPRPITPVIWARRAAIWAVLAVGLLLALRLDLPVMRLRYEYMRGELGGWGRQIDFGFRDFGQVVPIVATLIVVLRMDRRRWLIIMAVLLAQALASLGYNAGKYTIARYRPYAAVEAFHGPSSIGVRQTWIGWDPALRPENTRSFPSGHAGAAFAFAGAMAWFYPRLRGLLWVLACGCACSRVVDAVHWPSDIYAGAVIGYMAAWVALRPYVWALPVILWRRGYKRRQARRRQRATAV